MEKPIEESNKKDSHLLKKLDEYEMEITCYKDEIERLHSSVHEKDRKIEELTDQVMISSQQLKNETAKNSDAGTLKRLNNDQDEEVSQLINKYMEELKSCQ